MKKIYLILASLLLIGNLGFAKDVEVVKNSRNEEIVLKPDKTWETIDSYQRKSKFQNMVKVENLKVEGKRNQSRRVSFDVVNNSDYDLEYVVYKIKILFGDEYSLREIFTVRNVKSEEKKEVSRFINVEEVDGRDVVVEVFDFKMKTR